MARVLIADSVAESAVQRMKDAGLEIVIRNASSDGPIEEHIKGFDGVVVRSATKITREVIEASDKLRVIVRAGVGLDNVDAEAAKEKGILVMNTPEAPSVSVAELVIAMMFALARSITQADSYMKGERWEKKKLTGTELWQKTLGIVGFGRIGHEVAKRAKALEMDVLAYDVIDISDACEKYGAKTSTLDEIITKSDYITLHVPLLPQTKGMIGAAEFDKMKTSAFIINTARGGVIDEKALLEALEEGKIAGAALDVFENEPPTDWKLAKHPKLIATPHIASSTNEAQDRVGDLTAEKIIDAFK